MVKKCDDKIEHRRFDNGFADLRGLARRSGAGKREDARADDRADAKAGKIQHVE